MLKDNETPTLANKGQTPYIPTGYESLQGSVARKRRIGEALMQQGMAGPQGDVRSWAQLLGSLAQTWAGKSIQKDADKEEASIQEQIKQEVTRANQGFEADLAAGLEPAQLVQKWGSNQWLRARLDPYEKALGEGLKNKQEFNTPVEMLGADGKPVTVQTNKAGDIRPATGGFQLPPVITNINDVAVALQRQTPGTVLPQNLTESVIRGPDGKPVVNQPALDAKTRVAAAGAPNSKITVNNAEDFSKAQVDILKTSREAAMGAIGTKTAVGRIRKALNTGRADTGPFSGAMNWVERVAGINKGGREQRQIIEQNLNYLILAARKKLTGSGPISNFETELLIKADGGDISKMTDVEILALLDVADAESDMAINNHNDQLEAAKGVAGSEQYIPAFQLPEMYRRRKVVPTKRTTSAPTAARNGLPPRGADASATKARPETVDKYLKMFSTGGI
jgi:hypothetical protein